MYVKSFTWFFIVFSFHPKIFWKHKSTDDHFYQITVLHCLMRGSVDGDQLIIITSQHVGIISGPSHSYTDYSRLRVLDLCGPTTLLMTTFYLRRSKFSYLPVWKMIKENVKSCIEIQEGYFTATMIEFHF